MKLRELVAGFPPPYLVDAEVIGSSVRKLSKVFVVLDDDPTGTQSIADVPVLLRWAVEDIAWALRSQAPAVYVMTNSRSLSPSDAERVTSQVVSNSLEASRATGIDVGFISRSDSTLRGHFPLEPETIQEVVNRAGVSVSGICVIPAFPDAGRISVAGIHYAGNLLTDEYTPVAETEFARDATFGYRSSNLVEWVLEKGFEGKEDAVREISLNEIRRGPKAVVQSLQTMAGFVTIVFDCVSDDDLKVVTQALRELESAGRNYIYRVGPPFIRALIGQERQKPLERDDFPRSKPEREGSQNGGLIVIGSHTDLTTSQLNFLRRSRVLKEHSLNVGHFLGDGDRLDPELSEGIVSDLDAGHTVLFSTSRKLVTGQDSDSSLSIARRVSAGVCNVIKDVIVRCSPRFVLAKGGITSSDVALKGLEIHRATAVGSLLPGLVSLWRPLNGPARGIPYVVFPGNVGGEDALANVVNKLEG